jgi:hypothetical protein
MPKALVIQEKRVIQPGSGGEFYWFVSAATSLVGQQVDPARSDEMKRQAVDRVSKILYTMLALTDQPCEWSLASEVSMLMGLRDHGWKDMLMRRAGCTQTAG